MLKSYSIVRKIVNVSSTSIKRSQSLKSGQQMRSFAAQKQPELQQAVREHIPLKPSSADQFAANAAYLKVEASKKQQQQQQQKVTPPILQPQQVQQIAAKVAEQVAEQVVEQVSKPVTMDIPDPSVLFESTWKKLENKYGKQGMCFPKEIIFLMGSPGAGKSVQAPFILSARGITEPEIEMSALLTTAECNELKAQASLVPDQMVIDILFETLLQERYRLNGCVVDGFPRTKVQAECIKLLKERMDKLRSDFQFTDLREKFPRPVFRMCVLFVDEHTSVERQLRRGKEAYEHNIRCKATGEGELVEERFTDFNIEKARQRYAVFASHFGTLQELKKHFSFTLIDSAAPLHQVRQKIEKEFEYQSSLELATETYDVINRIPLADLVGLHARQQLIRRLDNYRFGSSILFQDVIGFAKEIIVPKIEQHSFAGEVHFHIDNVLFNNALAINMLVDVLAERGYSTTYIQESKSRPIKVDLQSGNVLFEDDLIHKFKVTWPKFAIRKTETK